MATIDTLIAEAILNKENSRTEATKKLQDLQPQILATCARIEQLIASVDFVVTKTEKYGFLKIRTRKIQTTAKAKPNRLTHENGCVNGLELVIPHPCGGDPTQFIEIDFIGAEQTAYIQNLVVFRFFKTPPPTTKTVKFDEVPKIVAEILLDYPHLKTGVEPTPSGS